MGLMTMNMKQLAEDIYQLDIPTDEKIRRLRDLALDCQNELDAQDQNMHPEVQHRLSEGLRVATDYLRELQATS